MRLKDTLFYKYEKPHVKELVTNQNRVDGRTQDEYRKLDIQFGKEWGVCIVTLGETKVMSQVTCEVQQPKTVRPNEGLLFLNVEISPMAAPNMEQSTMSELHVHLSRLLEKCIKDSHCVDLESLCIVAEEKVWNIRVDLVVLNYEGNVVGCASVAAIAALSHFRRPDVTVDEDKLIIHTAAEKDLIPLSMRHYPVAICYAIFDNGNNVLADPTDIEERNSEAELVLGMNAYRELCGIYLSGAVLQELDILLQCSQKAALTAAVLVQQIKTAIELDEAKRKQQSESGIVANIDVDRQLPASQCRAILLTKQKINDEIAGDSNNISKSEELNNQPEEVTLSDDDFIEIVPSGFKSAEIVEKKKRKNKKKKKVKSNKARENSPDKEESTSKHKTFNLLPKDNEESEIIVSSSDDDIALVKEITSEDRIIERIELTGDSEEEDVLTIMPNDINNVPKKMPTKEKIKDESY